MFFVLYSELGDLGCIGECSGLERLDLSYNDVTRLHSLASLTSLVSLNLSANRISCLGEFMKYSIKITFIF